VKAKFLWYPFCGWSGNVSLLIFSYLNGWGISHIFHTWMAGAYHIYFIYLFWHFIVSSPVILAYSYVFFLQKVYGMHSLFPFNVRATLFSVDSLVCLFKLIDFYATLWCPCGVPFNCFGGKTFLGLTWDESIMNLLSLGKRILYISLWFVCLCYILKIKYGFCHVV
jgi:hypothetical protein